VRAHLLDEIPPRHRALLGPDDFYLPPGQYGKFNISFVAVNPGPVRTERGAGLVKAMARDMKLTYEQADELAPRSIPLRRIAEVKEVANLCAYLASPLAYFVNGTMIEIDGGQQKPLMDAARG
jgi:3-oxoacyl-[acyl-carrier protein] reductase